MKITSRSKIAARSGPLKLLVRHVAGETIWKMKGGRFGEHTLREPGYNARVSAHWVGYLANNGATITYDAIPRN